MSIGINTNWNDTSLEAVSLGEEIDKLQKQIDLRNKVLKEVLQELKPNEYLKRNTLIRKIKKCIKK